MKPRRYKPGAVLTLAEVVQHIVADRYLYVRGRLVHPAWMASMPLRAVAIRANGSVIRAADILKPGTSP